MTGPERGYGSQFETPQTSAEQPVEIPMDLLEPDVLKNLVREYVLREGTDYGAVEIGLDVKIQQVLRQLEKGDVKIFFDASTESVTLNPTTQRSL